MRRKNKFKSKSQSQNAPCFDRVSGNGDVEWERRSGRERERESTCCDSIWLAKHGNVIQFSYIFMCVFILYWEIFYENLWTFVITWAAYLNNSVRKMVRKSAPIRCERMTFCSVGLVSKKMRCFMLFGYALQSLSLIPNFSNIHLSPPVRFVTRTAVHLQTELCVCRYLVLFASLE